jgi:hypothetical protein
VQQVHAKENFTSVHPPAAPSSGFLSYFGPAFDRGPYEKDIDQFITIQDSVSLARAIREASAAQLIEDATTSLNNGDAQVGAANAALVPTKVPTIFLPCYVWVTAQSAQNAIGAINSAEAYRGGAERDIAEAIELDASHQSSAAANLSARVEGMRVALVGLTPRAVAVKPFPQGGCSP